MQIFNKVSVATKLVASFGFVAFGLAGPIAAVAATSPSLGTAATYSVLAGSQVTNTGATTVSGNVGISPGIGVAPHYTGFGTVTFAGASTVHDADTAAATAQSEMNAVYTTDLNQTCTTDYGAVTKELAGEVLTPGVYCANSFHLTNGTLTLNGAASDVWVFKSASDLIITGSSANVIFTGGGLPCNVWWRVVSTATLDAGSVFVGNILADTSITLAAGASLDGRALARTAEVTLSSNAITGPTCSAATVPTPVVYGGRATLGTITVIKTVINDNGGIKTVADFPLFVNGMPVISGQTNNFVAPAASYFVTETPDPNYTMAFSNVDCNAEGRIDLNRGDNMICLVANDDIGAPAVPVVPPLIDVVKVPSPLALPAGPGAVTYTYTVRNIGTVPMTDVTLAGDTCSPINFVSGDTNGDTKLGVSEAWVYKCSTTLSETHTNTVIATGWANGISAVDLASANVVVGVPVVPPLIHITKVPNPLALRAGGGMVTYTNKVSNPGTVALSNISVTDDKCASVKYVSGDVNNNLRLDTTETWTYTCRASLTKTTVNTAVASGVANGITVKDFAIATVVVAAVVPKLPNTGFAPWHIIIPTSILALVLVSISLFVIRSKRSI